MQGTPTRKRAGLGLSAFAPTLLLLAGLLLGCGEETAPTATGNEPPPEDTATAPEVSDDTGTPQEACKGQADGTPCDDGDPCTIDDVCNGAGGCVGGASALCPESDGNLCTEPRCDAATGNADNNYCVESPLDGTEVQNTCFRYQCSNGTEEVLGPSESNNCDTWELPQAGCISAYVCDPSFSDSSGGNCRPTYQPSGARCQVETPGGLVGVKAAGQSATDEAASACLYYVCYAPAGAGAETSETACVLSSTLSEEVQGELVSAGNALDYSCGLDALPGEVNAQCNEWACGCSDETCQEAECLAEPKTSQVLKACDNGNSCDGSVCLPVKEEGTAMECAPPQGVEADACDLFPEATCDVSGPCDPETGCPNAMDLQASNAQCQVNNPCLDPFNTFCAPNDPNADPVTGCVVSFKAPGTPCGEALKDACVLDATCEVSGESMKCEVNEFVTCNDGNDCTKDFCTDGECQTTDLPGECDDGDACTGDDLCQAGNCAGNPISCNDGLDCTVDSCNTVSGCSHLPQNDLCDDEQTCTDDTCVVGVGCQNDPGTGANCSDDNLCTENDVCVNGACVGSAITQESNVCDQVDNDCDGLTDENCSLVLRSQHTGDGQGVSQGGGLLVRHRLGAPRIFGQASDDTHTVHSGTVQGEGI